MVAESESKTESKKNTYRVYGNYGKYISIHLTDEDQIKKLESRISQSGKKQNKFIIDSLFDSHSSTQTNNGGECRELAKVFLQIFINQRIKGKIPESLKSLLNELMEELE